MGQPSNTLYYGDNLDILRRYIDDESVDLILLEPHINSSGQFRLLRRAEHAALARPSKGARR
jgi:hypothetical protein